MLLAGSFRHGVALTLAHPLLWAAGILALLHPKDKGILRVESVDAGSPEAAVGHTSNELLTCGAGGHTPHSKTLGTVRVLRQLLAYQTSETTLNPLCLSASTPVPPT